MLLDTIRVRGYLRAFDLKKLFIEELGWDHYTNPLSVMVDGQAFTLAPVAQKRGFIVATCGSIPEYALRSKIERQVAQSVHEHLIIYVDKDQATQTWQWVRREIGKPIARREHTYHRNQPGDALIQKLQALAFGFEQEETLTLVDVIGGVMAGFDVAQVTKRFYERFKTEHAAFLKFLKGIPDQDMQRWYVSVMLNRLMFIYFIQKKGLIDGDVDYMTNKLAASQARGKDRFYKDLLCPLFFEGLAQQQQSPHTRQLLGHVPYLNGGLFLRHQIEEHYGRAIQIPDAAFARLFEFFDAYRWHLDERPLREDNEINPDVLGYIFEKYINQKQMGAYYTKEDITGYISQETIIPYLFDVARQKCKVAFEGEQSVWRLLQADPDRYIYPAVRHGVQLPLPLEIAAGLNHVAKRAEWNKSAPEDYALPTEIWREVAARRKRYEDVRAKLVSGDIRDINDLITHNLDMRQFAQDVIENSEGPELVRAFWHAIESITVLDPTVGSGAFLFAALNVLEPLYEACLDRMEAFLADLERAGGKHRPEKYADFRKVLERMAQHPNRRYFVLKSIIINNLFGVDIMEEAVEICKLRLFLKLVAQVEQADKIEPLPDIDFNIRAGNTLVGFATHDEVNRAITTAQHGQMKLTSDSDLSTMRRIDESAEIADRAFAKFHQMQTEQGMQPADFAQAKRELRQRLDTLNDELNRYLAGEYGMDVSKKTAYEKWLASHRPFHWFVEFYGILKDGGFDVIIGNPPWREYSAVKKEYTLLNYATESCGNLYGICTERASALRDQIGRMSFIVQLPMASSSRMVAVRDLLREKSHSLHVIPFDDRPGKLFEGLQNCRSVVFLSQGHENHNPSLFATTRYQRWATEARGHLLAQLEYAKAMDVPIYPGQFPKYANALEVSVFQKVAAKGDRSVAATLSARETKHCIFYQEATRYWVKATVGLPYYAKNGTIGTPAHGRFLHFDRAESAKVICALLNSSLFYVYFLAYGDCFHLSDNLVSGFPINLAVLTDGALVELSKRLMAALKSSAERKTIVTKDGDKIAYDEYYGWKSKPIIDEIDRVLARHYGFTDEELDFIINYDIKYRMGKDAEERV